MRGMGEKGEGNREKDERNGGKVRGMVKKDERNRGKGERNSEKR